MHQQATSRFYDEFYAMEDDSQVKLDPDNPIHRRAMHYVYLPIINASLDEFRKGWNNHKLRFRELHDTTAIMDVILDIQFLQFLLSLFYVHLLRQNMKYSQRQV